MAGGAEMRERQRCSMKSRSRLRILLCVSGLAGAALIALCCAIAAPRDTPPQAARQAPVARQVGVIKNINGNAITLTTDTGGDITVEVASNAQMVRVAPGQTDLKNAVSIQLSDLRAGDRILVRGQPSSTDAKSFIAVGLIAMSRSDVEAKQQQDREDWQKRGIGGLVSSVDLGTRTITISTAATGRTKTIAVHAAGDTILRRYAPGSIRFDEAEPAPLDQIKPGDQLRARGARSADGSEFAAVEIVSGSFRNIAGTVRSIDPNGSSMIVMDLINKKPFLVTITNQSQLRKLPPEVANRIAFRLKATPGGAPADAAVGGRTGGGQMDFQQIVNRIKTARLSDFKKDDAVMIVATEGTASGQATAITVLGGVEPILAAAPASTPAMTLSPWSLGGAPAEDGNAQ
jgi:hypothetical protein